MNGATDLAGDGAREAAQDDVAQQLPVTPPMRQEQLPAERLSVVVL